MSQTIVPGYQTNYQSNYQTNYQANQQAKQQSNYSANSQPYSSYLHQNPQQSSYSYLQQQNGPQSGYLAGQKNCQTIGPNFLSNNSSKNSNTLKNSATLNSANISNTFNNSNILNKSNTLNGSNTLNNLKNANLSNQDDFCLKNGQFRARIYPSISFGDCSEIHILQPKKSLKRHFFSSAIKNSKSLGGYLFSKGRKFLDRLIF